MTKTVTIFAAAALAIGFAASPAKTGAPTANGLTFNGLSTTNGITLNGLREQNGLAGTGVGGIVTGVTLPGGATLPVLAR